MSVDTRLRSSIERLRGSLFLVPMVAVVLAVGAGIGTVAIDSRLDANVTDVPFFLASTVESARALLSTIAGATITFAGIAFSVSLLVIQLASSQYSPRVVHTLFRDPFNKRVMGVVIGTFTYCVIVLRSVRTSLEDNGEAVVPNLSVNVAVVLGIGAVLSVVAFINHNAHTMDVTAILQRVEHQALEQIEGAWEPLAEADPPATPVAPPSGGRLVRFDRSGWIQMIDFEALIQRIPDNTTVVVHTYAGRYAVNGGTFCTVALPTSDDEVMDDDLLRAAVIGGTRTMQQDVSYGLRQLVDVALRALSPGINDPTTAQDAVFHATNVLAELLRRDPPGAVTDDRGRTVLAPEAPDHRELIALTFDEVRRVAGSQPTVCIYLLEALRLLTEATAGVLTDAAHDEIYTQATLVVAQCERGSHVAADVVAVREAFRSRFGSSTPG